MLESWRSTRWFALSVANIWQTPMWTRNVLTILSLETSQINLVLRWTMLWSSLQTMNLILTSLEKEDIGLANHRCVVIELAHQDNQLRETVRISRTCPIAKSHLRSNIAPKGTNWISCKVQEERLIGIWDMSQRRFCQCNLWIDQRCETSRSYAPRKFVHSWIRWFCQLQRLPWTCGQTWRRVWWQWV